MIAKIWLSVVIVCLTVEILAAERHRPNHARLRSSRQLPEFLTPPPAGGGLSTSAIKPRHTPSRNHRQHDQETSPSLVQRVARWFFDNGEDGPPPQQSQQWPVKQFHGPSKANFGLPPPPNFHSPPRASFNTYGPPPKQNNHRGPMRPSNFYGPPRPAYGPPPPPKTLNLPQFPGNFQGLKSQHQITSPSGSDNGRDCNPCNKVPWVPIPSTSSGVSHGKNPGFNHGGHDYQHSGQQLPLEEYGSSYGSPEFPPLYGPPLLPNVARGPPFNPDGNGKPSDSYGQSIHSSNNNQLAVNINDHFATGDNGDSHPLATQNTGDDTSVHLVPEADNKQPFGTTAHDQAQLSSGHEINTVKPLDTSQRQNEGHIITGVEAVKSVNVANYISSVEYPLEIIQSPYIDLTQQTGSTGSDGHHSHSQFHHHLTSPGQGDIVLGKPNHNQEHNKHSFASGDSHGTSSKQVETITVNFGQGIDQKEATTKVQQVVSTSNGRIVKGRPIVQYHPSGTDTETANSFKQNTKVPVDVKALDSSKNKPDLDFTGEHKTRFTGKVSDFNIIKEQGLDNTGEYHTGTTIFDFAPSVQTQKQGTSLIHNINNLNIFTQQLPPSAPFTNNYHQIPSHISFPSHSSSQNTLSSSSPSLFKDSFHHPPPPPPPVDVLHDESKFNQRPFVIDHLETPVPFLNPPREDQKSNYVTYAPSETTSLSSVSTSKNSIQTTWGADSSSQNAFIIPDSQAVATFDTSGMLPPPPLSSRPYQTNKKPKQIQVIVPYTSSKQLMQFEFERQNKPTLDHTGWHPLSENEANPSSNQARRVPAPSNCSKILADASYIGQPQWHKCITESDEVRNPLGNNVHNRYEEDYHQHEESRTVTATIAQTPRPVGTHTVNTIQHIFAPNIRALLKGEANAGESNESLMLRLQKNIDKWTALEFSNGKGSEKSRDDERKGTTSLLHLLVPSKKIPDAYLTTTPSTFDDGSSENMVATAVPKIKQLGLKGSVTPYFDHEVASSFVHTRKSYPDKHTSEKVTKSFPIINVTHTELANKTEVSDKLFNNWGTLDSNLIVSAAVTSLIKETTRLTVGTTASPTLTSPKWGRLQVSISPITNEKVYVVTPISSWLPETTPAPTRQYTRAIPQVTSRSFNTPRSNLHSSSDSTVKLGDAFPFRNGAVSQKEAKSFSFNSPRFLIRPTPGVSQQRGFTPSQSDTNTSLEDNLVKKIDTKNYHRMSTSRVINVTATTPAFTNHHGSTESPPHTQKSTHPKVHTITGHSKVVVTVPTTATTNRRKWTGYDAIRPTTLIPSTPKHSEKFLRTLAELLNPRKEVVSPGDSQIDEDIVAAVRGADIELKKERGST